MSESSININWPASDKLRDSANYPTWKNQVKQALMNASVYPYAMGKGKGIKPTHFEPDDDCNEESEYGKWLKGNSRACTIIYRTCGPDAQRMIQSTEDAAQA
jgi:hypothetical protein